LLVDFLLDRCVLKKARTGTGKGSWWKHQTSSLEFNTTLSGPALDALIMSAAYILEVMGKMINYERHSAGMSELPALFTWILDTIL
jgi:hypothetical protein